MTARAACSRCGGAPSRTISDIALDELYRPGMVLDLAARHGVDLTRSWLVGDQDRDIQCGQAAGVRTVLLARPYNSGTESGADHVIDTLSQALSLMVRQPAMAAPQ